MLQEEIKHLDHLQSIINRMAANQFQIKGWMVTVNTAILTIFANSFGKENGPNAYFLLVALFPTLIFWLLDARFLCQERRMRRVYADVASHRENIRPFELPVERYKKGKCTMPAAMFSFANVLVYFLVLLGFAAGFVLCMLL